MQTIRISVIRDTRFRSSDGFQIYGDGGTGIMDYAHPLTPRRMLFWEDALPMAPHLLNGHVMGCHLDSVYIEGHLCGTHLLDAHDLPAGVSTFEMGPFVFGRFRHAVVTEDELGNAQTAGITVYETVVNSAPPVASNLVPQTYDAATGVLMFSFTPSEKLVG